MSNMPKTIGEPMDRLEVAVSEYNSAASEQKRDTMAKNGCQLKSVLAQAQELQEAASTNEEDKSLGRNIQAGLQQFCKTTLHYAATMNTLAQHNLEWVSLAWGMMKLLLMIPIEYQKAKEDIVTNLGRIGSKLELVRRRGTGAPQSVPCRLLHSARSLLDTPFDTRLGPILKTIDENYDVLRRQAEVQFMIYQFERDCSLQRDLMEIKEDHWQFKEENVRIISVLEASQGLDRELLKPPRLELCEDFFQNLLPLDNNSRQVQLEIELLPMYYLSESIDVLRLPSFQAWLSSTDPGLLWVDGYKIPRRPSWTTDLSFKIVRAVTESGYDTLSYFGSLHRRSNDDTPKPRTLLQSLLFSMLQKFPAVTSYGDPNLLVSPLSQ
ncbi:hypothetical protein CSAL01_12052, partial [Colletotrichum salicis]